MNYRIQDFLNQIFPGLYLIGAIIAYLAIKENGLLDEVYIKNIKELQDFIILLIPFIGYVVGYIIGCIMSFVEHKFYDWFGRRPSCFILKGDEDYEVADIDLIRTTHQINNADKIDSKKSKKILQVAKQMINRDEVEQLRINSILARNITGSHFFFMVLVVILNWNNEFSCPDKVLLLVSLVIILFLGRHWIHWNKVYVKYIFAKYAKVLENRRTQEQTRQDN